VLRILLQYVLPLTLPFLAWLIYVRLTHKRGGMNDAPWIGLAAAGVGLLVVSLVTWTLFSGSEPGETYLPARIEDGRLVPGTTEP